MPTLAQEQIDEIEHEMSDLVDALNDMTRQRDAAVAEIARMRATGEVV